MKNFTTLNGSNDYYIPEQINKIVPIFYANAEIIKTNKKIEYYNEPCAFDIETTSFYENDEKRAIMYEWTLGLRDFIIVGRTWEQFFTCYQIICEKLKTNLKKRLVIYIQNESFEFQFLRKWLNWEEVFSLDERKPIRALTAEGIEFRCSYALSGYSLETIGKNLKKYPVQKLVGDLDYKLLRHSKTPLTQKEIGYCINDVKVVISYIKECMERDGDISKIQMTKTGYVRKYCRNSCMYNGSHKKNTWKYITYRRIMNQLQLTPEEYKQLKRAFCGGFTHASCFYTGKTMYNVRSFDFTSSYPAVMVSEQFPMSKGETIKITSKDEFEKNLKLYCCLFDVEFTGLEATTIIEHPISSSRCWDLSGFVTDNGRIVEAKTLKTTITEQDYFIIRKFYKWKTIKIANFRRYKKGYLPRDFVKAILKLYCDKTTLKGVEGKEEEYLNSKEKVNALYGMTVTDIVREIIEYSDDTDEWGTKSPDLDENIEKYNKSVKRFLFYPWGVWVTAYARKNLFTAIWEFQGDYIYSDTDSVKVLNYSKHMEYINRYNANIIRKLEKACKYQGIDVNSIRPKTIDGREKILGVWDDEGEYSRFKTLGAKRYMTEKDGKLSITVSGVNKRFAVPYIQETYKGREFDAFNDGLYIPPERTGKNIHTYIDDEQTGVLRDYLGVTEHYYEKSSVHLEPTEYSLSLSKNYIDYLMGVREFYK